MGTFVPFWCLYPKGPQIPRNRAQEEVASPASPATMARNPLNERVDFAWNVDQTTRWNRQEHQSMAHNIIQGVD